MEAGSAAGGRDSPSIRRLWVCSMMPGSASPWGSSVYGVYVGSVSFEGGGGGIKGSSDSALDVAVVDDSGLSSLQINLVSKATRHTNACSRLETHGSTKPASFPNIARILPYWLRNSWADWVRPSLASMSSIPALS